MNEWLIDDDAAADDTGEPVNGLGPMPRRAFLKLGVGAAAAIAVTPALGAGASTFGQRKTAKEVLTVTNWHTQDATTSLGKSWTVERNAYMAKNPGVTVALQGQPFATYLASATAACIAHKSADITMYQPDGNFSSIWRCGSSISTAEQKSLFPNLQSWSDAQVPLPGGRTFGIPLASQGFTLYYNRALFSKAGLDPSTPPQTWDAFQSACTALVKAGDRSARDRNLRRRFPLLDLVGFRIAVSERPCGRPGRLYRQDQDDRCPLRQVAGTVAADVRQRLVGARVRRQIGEQQQPDELRHRPRGDVLWAQHRGRKLVDLG